MTHRYRVVGAGAHAPALLVRHEANLSATAGSFPRLRTSTQLDNERDDACGEVFVVLRRVVDVRRQTQEALAAPGRDAGLDARGHREVVAQISRVVRVGR